MGRRASKGTERPLASSVMGACSVPKDRKMAARHRPKLMPAAARPAIQAGGLAGSTGAAAAPQQLSQAQAVSAPSKGLSPSRKPTEKLLASFGGSLPCLTWYRNGSHTCAAHSSARCRPGRQGLLPLLLPQYFHPQTAAAASTRRRGPPC